MDTADATVRATDPLTFRTATEADVEGLVALIESAYRGDASRAGWTTEADILDGQRTDPEDVTDVVGAENGRMMIVERNGEPIACCQLEHRGDHAYFGMFAVRPALQGGGLGKVIIAEAERFARAEWGAKEMHMTVISAREELIAWYERRGYARTGRMTPFPYGEVRFGVPRRADLEFELLIKPLG
ncbi:GNAT family N-acetyltransferase [Streptomyces iranensis]|uniref:GCN5-related N-acetyltransferase n=1 Tax=Streptomyces iranensis TaxID=576784 RepID=A0A061A1S3_9ACTN|nr:GNAT family N-acetyltransferase [Streptomyces iranensis]MBP2059734.1 ribosomal protein S18 acetylase RimI-like enzyme [Streptomyces iranensis]CDR15081.1 GCN5-related N-acetyltransferase [Streptomyces iranensis]